MTNPFTPPVTLDGDNVYTPKVLGQASRVRSEISQHSTTRVGLQILAGGSFVDPDEVQATLYQKTDFSPGSDTLGPGLLKEEPDLNHESTGVYSFVLDPTVTALLSQITIGWEYVIDGITYQYWDYYQILDYMPIYESLNEGEKGVVRIVSAMFEDLYDSVEGGPHLKEQFQSHFGAETIARCMELAMSRINTTSQPYTSYNVGFGTGPRFPSDKYSILIMGTYLEVVRHLIRSYVEMPDMKGSADVAYMDRSQYMARWTNVLEMEKDDYKLAVVSFKRSLLGLGGGSLIVAGGIYGNINGGWRSGMYSAQVRGARFTYPASVVQIRPGAY